MEEVVNDERERRPDVQGVPRTCVGCTKESQIEAVGVVIEKRHFSSVDTRVPALSSPVFFVHEHHPEQKSNIST